jgi:diguanylate cyclase (GGDEF)-like protein
MTPKGRALARLALLSGLGARDFERLGRMAEEVDFPAGKVLCREGATPQEFFLIVEGDADVAKEGEFVRRLGSGDFFGESGLIERTPQGTTVTAATPLRCFVLSGHGFRNLIDSYPEVERRVLRKLVVQSVAERQIAERALRKQTELIEHQALHDSLTGLPNRALFRDRIEQALLLSIREGTEFTVMMIDLDRFKEVNDTLGHHAGDLLLQTLSERLLGELRASDTIARLGGDEFGLVLNRAAADALPQIVDKIRGAIEKPVLIHGLPIGVEASIGGATYPGHGGDVDTLIQCADVAMYVAKRENRPFALYDPESSTHDPLRLTLIGELRRAIDAHELILHYQPKAALRSGSVQSVEALLRWNHPERGLIMPDAFIPLAQQTGLIKPLTLYVIEEAIKQCLSWQREGLALSVAVNLSTRNLLDVDFAEDVGRLMAKHRIEPRLLEFEITETTMFADPVRAKLVLERLSAMGIRLSIDDFGVGYSSLSYLKSLPINEIKIDRSFVLTMLDNADDAVIVRSTIDLGRNLGLEVVAEGVESREIWDQLGQLGCDLAQGYFLSRPVTAAALSAWVRDAQERPAA